MLSSTLGWAVRPRFFARGFAGGAGGARLVLNHSSHIPGLISVLERLARSLPGGRVTPGAIARCRPAFERSLRLKVSASPPISGGFKLTARRGGTVQEVFVGSNITKEALEEAVLQAVSPHR